MRRRTNVVLESTQRKLRRLHPAADERAALQNQAAVPRLGQIRRRDQTIVPSSRNDNVEWIRHQAAFPRQSAELGLKP
jgi:hypothetical protein